MRMFVINPASRASLGEVLSHSWTVRGHGGPPDPRMLHREPLRVEDIDMNVMKGMAGFKFGTEQEIYDNLESVLSSESYMRAVQ